MINILLLFFISYSRPENVWKTATGYREEPNVGNIGISHHVNGKSIFPPWPENAQVAVVGMGCFWGAERLFWKEKGVLLSVPHFYVSKRSDKLGKKKF